ncbi:MAG: hypothetical protein KAG18_03490 [Sinobacterium sp.]|nr:hypothetical protein [Sinobacterium sp.]
MTVHKQSQQQLLVSWSDDGRKLSGKTLRIFERIVGGVKSNKNIHVYVSISAEEVDNAPGLAQLNSDYKANYIQKALLKQCGNACQASVAGIGSAINANKVFVAIFKGESGKPSLVAFE